MAPDGAAAALEPVGGLIAFASAIVDAAAYVEYARAGILAAAEPGAAVFALEAVGDSSRRANLLLDAAAAREDLEALVIVDERVELDDPHLCAKVRAALADPDVAVAGWMGATGVRTLAWWDGAVSAGPVEIAFDEFGGGRLPAFCWTTPTAPPEEVDVVDGRVLVLSPWAVRNLRFDETITLGHGWELDLCLRAREQGRKVVTIPVRAAHHHAVALVPQVKRDVWVEAHIRFAERWDGRMPGGPPPETDWKARARRAEAERDVARTIAYSSEIRVDAHVEPLERRLAAMLASREWRLTAPLRALNRRLARRRAPAAARPSTPATGPSRSPLVPAAATDAPRR